jgi:hypothetical protein
MAAKLKERFKQIPGGLKFYQPETKWQPRAWASFDEVVNSLIAHRKANPFLTQKHGRSTDQAPVEAEVDAFNAGICQQMGWSDYIVQAEGGAAAQSPFPSPSYPPPPNSPDSASVAAVKRMASGAATIVDWLTSGSQAVPAELSAKRAGVCVTCPKHSTQSISSWFSAPVAAVIKKELERRADLKLSTPFDDRLGICTVCSCQMSLKVHASMEVILRHLRADTRSQLWPECWILKEA